MAGRVDKGAKGAKSRTLPHSQHSTSSHSQHTPPLKRRLRLIQVQAFSRHGHRTAASMLHTLEEEQPLWEHVLGNNATLRHSDATTRTLERYLHGCSIRSIPPANDHGQDVPFLDAHDKYHFLGRLTPLGEQQMRTLGNSFRERYVYTHKLLPHALNADDLSVQSTLNRRTVYSLNYFLLGLYPLDKRKEIFSAPIQLGVYSNPRDEVLWPIWSPRFAEIEKETFRDPPRDDIVRIGRLFEPRYRSNSVYFWARVYDILHSRLFVKHELPLSLQREDFSKIEQHFVESWNSVFQTKEAQRIAMGRCIGVILRRFKCALGDTNHNQQVRSYENPQQSYLNPQINGHSPTASSSSSSLSSLVDTMSISHTHNTHATHTHISHTQNAQGTTSVNGFSPSTFRSHHSHRGGRSQQAFKYTPSNTSTHSHSKDNTNSGTTPSVPVPDHDPPHTNAHTPRMFVGSCHDNSLFALLKIFTQQKNVKWPRFASCVVLELYETVGGCDLPQEVYVQILMNFRPIRVPCQPIFVEGRDGEVFYRYSEFSAFLKEFVPVKCDEERKSPD